MDRAGILRKTGKITDVHDSEIIKRIQMHWIEWEDDPIWDVEILQIQYKEALIILRFAENSKDTGMFLSSPFPLCIPPI